MAVVRVVEEDVGPGPSISTDNEWAPVENNLDGQAR